MPTLPLVEEAMAGWARLLEQAIGSLLVIDTADARELAEKLSARLHDHDAPGWIFTVNAALDFEPAGKHTWMDRLPRQLRLVASFSRQFWPQRLADLGIGQLDTDILMRNQMPAQHPGLTHLFRPEAEINARLVDAMTQVVEEELKLQIPVAFRGPRAAR